MSLWRPILVTCLSFVVLNGYGGGSSITGIGEEDFDFDFLFPITSTPFPDGHEHSILALTCDEFRSGRDITFSPLSPINVDHDHKKVTVTVQQQAEIVRGNRVVVQSMDIHPHNWPFDFGNSCN